MTIADEQKSQERFATEIAPYVVEDKIKDNEEDAKSWLLSDDEEVRKFLYNLDDDRIVSLMGNAGIRMEVFPHLYNDGVVLPKEGFDTKRVNDVPLMMVTGEKEFSLFALFDPYFNEAYLDKSLWENENRLKEFNFVDQYGGQMYSLFNVADSAEKLDKNYSSDIYNMEISFGDNPEYVDNVMSEIGSFHGVFVPLLDSDNKNYDAFVGSSYKSNGAKELKDNFQTYLYEFISNGNPNNDTLPKWTAWNNNNGKKSLYLDANKDNSIIELKNKEYSYYDILKQIKEYNSLPHEKKEELIKTVLNARCFSSGLDEEYHNLSSFYK